MVPRGGCSSRAPLNCRTSRRAVLCGRSGGDLGCGHVAAGLFDEGEAGVDAANVVGEVAAADRCHGEIVVDKPRGFSGAVSGWDGRGVGVSYEDSLSAG